MLKKRKLTASFLEIPFEKDTLLRNWRSGEHSDWTLTVGDSTFKVHKVIVATGDRASAFLAAAFRKHLGHAEEHTDLTKLLPRPCWPYFETVLDFIYSDKLEITAESWGPLVKMADVLQMGTLYTKSVEAGNHFLSGEDADQHAPRLAIDAVRLQLGGRLQEEVIQVAVDSMASCFKSVKTSDLVMQPVEVLNLLLQRDDLEVDSEDAVFDVLLELSLSLEKAQMELLWRCCRLQRLSPIKILKIADIDEIAKEAIVWAMANRPSPALSLTQPKWAHPWSQNAGCRGREIHFAIPDARDFVAKQHTRSESHRLLDKFSWRLLIFPHGTAPESTPGKTTAAFVELVPDADVDEWTVKGIRYSITAVNWKNEQKNITKEHEFQFSHTEVDNGWHRGFAPVEKMTEEEGWLNGRGELCFRGILCSRRAEVRMGPSASSEVPRQVKTTNGRPGHHSKGIQG